MQRLYTASESGGATCNDCALNVTQTSNLGQSLLVTGFGYDHGAPWQTNMELFKELTDASRGVRRLGAAAVSSPFVICCSCLGCSSVTCCTQVCNAGCRWICAMLQQACQMHTGNFC